ncbi:hypothetical protein ACFLT7_04925, partial [candidate division KSB1 bacterium]
MITRLVIVTCLILILIPFAVVLGQDQDLEKFMEEAYDQKKKSPGKALLLGVIPSLGHAYLGFSSWSNRGVFFLLGEVACITLSQTIGYSTQKRSIGPGLYEEWPNQPNFIYYTSIMAFSAFKIYELWDVRQQVDKHNLALKQRYDLTISPTETGTRVGLAI